VLFYKLILKGYKDGIRNAIVPAVPSLTAEVNTENIPSKASSFKAPIQFVTIEPDDATTLPLRPY
jgi:hypothetical protein